MQTDRRFDRRRSLACAAIAIAALIVAACATPAATPSGAAPSTSMAPASPAASTAVASPSAVTPTASPTTIPTPEPTKAFTTGRWVRAGEVTRELSSAALVALPDGGALLIGVQSDEDTSWMATEIWGITTQRWRPTTALPKMRRAFASVALADGRVLVAGGFNDVDASYSSAYLFEPATETWTKTGLMTVARTDPGIALLPDGRVLVAGGYFYAPEEWSGYGASSGPGLGDVMLAGWPAPGSDDTTSSGTPLYDVDVPPIGRALATAELFDPATGEWTPTGSMRYARSGPAVATLSDGRVLVVGSAGDNVDIDGRAYTTAEVYDPATERFTSMSTFPNIDYRAISRLGVDLPQVARNALAHGSLVALTNGGAVLVGQSAGWKHEGGIVRSFRLDAGHRTWVEIGHPYAWAGTDDTPTSTNTVSREGALVASLPDGSVLVAGGSPTFQPSRTEPARPPRSVERFDPAADTWSKLPSLPKEWWSMSGVRLADGSVLVAGGEVVVGSGTNAFFDWSPLSYRFVPR